MKLPKLIGALPVVLLVLMGPAAAQPSQGPDWRGLHDALRLRPDQEQAWQQFQRASEMDPQEAAQHRDAYQRMENLRAPQRMDLSIQLMRSDLQAMERRNDALKAFYGALSPDQQQSFDRETLRPPQ